MTTHEGAGEARARLDRQSWIDAAYAVLTSEGVDRVRVLDLANRLGVTRGSFYWHFDSRNELLDALIAIWRGRNTRAIVEAVSAAGADFETRYLNLTRCWLDQSRYDPHLDIAMRDWGRRDEAIGRMVSEADDERIAAIAAAFRDNGEGELMAFIRARVLYYMQVGYYGVGIKEPQERRIGLMSAYFEAFTGRPLDPARAHEMTDLLFSEQAAPATG